MEQRIKNSFSRQRERFALKHFEDNFNIRHHSWVEHRIDDKRNYEVDVVNSDNYLLQKNSRGDIEDLNSQVSHMKVDSTNTINLQNIHNFLSYIRQNTLTDKSKTKFHLKFLRKEISKDCLHVDVLNLLLNFEKNILLILADFLFDFKNSEIQIETIWILNNLCIFCHRYGFKDHFYQIHKILVSFMLSDNLFSNAGVKNLILEKFFSLVGNLLLYEENVYHFYIENNILAYLIKNLNSSVRSMRAVCLRNINVIITAIKNCSDSNISFQNSKNLIGNILFNNKEIIYYLKFLFGRIDPTKNFDECYEFLWLMNYIQIENSDLFSSFFLRDGVDSCVINLRKILDLLIIGNLHQPIIRILGNLLSTNYNTYFFSSEIAQMVFLDKNVMIFLASILKNNSINNNSKYFIQSLFKSNNDDCCYLLKDVVWFIKNLIHYDKNCFIQNYFAYDMVNLLSNLKNLTIEQNVSEDIIKNILIVLYLIFVSMEITYSDENFKVYSYFIDWIYKSVDYLFAFKLITLDLIINFIVLKHNRVIPINLRSHIDYIKEKNM